MNNNTQGVQNIALPDALKNAIELAQNRLSLLSGDEDRLRKLKLSLETEVSSLSDIIGEKDAECKKLEEKKEALKNETLSVKSDIEKLADTKQIEVDKVEALKVEAVALASDVDQKKDLARIIGVEISGKQTIINDLTAEIEKLKTKIEKFNTAISNLV